MGPVPVGEPVPIAAIPRSAVAAAASILCPIQTTVEAVTTPVVTTLPVTEDFAPAHCRGETVMVIGATVARSILIRIRITVVVAATHVRLASMRIWSVSTEHAITHVIPGGMIAMDNLRTVRRIRVLIYNIAEVAPTLVMKTANATKAHANAFVHYP